MEKINKFPEDWELKDMETYAADIRRMQIILVTEGIFMSPYRVYKAWSSFSDSMAAGWMIPDDDDDIVFSTIMSYKD